MIMSLARVAVEPASQRIVMQARLVDDPIDQFHVFAMTVVGLLRRARMTAIMLDDLEGKNGTPNNTAESFLNRIVADTMTNDRVAEVVALMMKKGIEE